MAENSKIEWTDHTFNPWRGCTKVSAGCQHCYADTLSKRNPGTLGIWGPNGSRVVAAESYWRQPLKLDKQAECLRTFDCNAGDHSDACPQSSRPRVFCASLGDVFEAWDGPMVDSQGNHLINCPNCGVEPYQANEPPLPEGCEDRDYTMDDVRARLFALPKQTPHLDWLFLTKRPENVSHMVPAEWRDKPPANVWLGTSVEDQATADKRIPELLKCRDLAPVLFLSCEPLLGPVELMRPMIYQRDYYCATCAQWFDHAAVDDHCPDCGHEHAEEQCPECQYEGEMELVCPECGTDGGNGGLSHAECWAREIEHQHGIGIDWLIAGGESGPQARPMQVEWVRGLRDQCQASGVPFFFKQWGEWIEVANGDTSECGAPSMLDNTTRPLPTVCWPGGRAHRCKVADVNGRFFGRVGKKAAGRLLDGREWNEFPQVKHHV